MIIIVSEAPHDNDWLLNQLLSQAGIARSECSSTTVFSFPVRDVKTLCGSRADGVSGHAPIVAGKYLRAEYASELTRLYREITHASPNVILALGATAAWAVLNASGIKAIRGSVAPTSSIATDAIGREVKVLPTYSPAAVGRQWTLRPIVISDFDKARRESLFSEYLRPSRKIWIRPILEDLFEFERLYINDAERLSADIETRQDQITCIGFAPSPHECLVIPFFDESGRSYWSHREESLVWSYVRKWLAAKPTVFQNGLYDINFLWSRYGIPVPLAAEDTMLLHHAYQPEMEKGLGFLATIYTDEASWKFMSKGKKHD
jgi:uracil-DNA glycosylase